MFRHILVHASTTATGSDAVVAVTWTRMCLNVVPQIQYYGSKTIVAVTAIYMIELELLLNSCVHYTEGSGQVVDCWQWAVQSMQTWWTEKYPKSYCQPGLWTVGSGSTTAGLSFTPGSVWRWWPTSLEVS